MCCLRLSKRYSTLTCSPHCASRLLRTGLYQAARHGVTPYAPSREMALGLQRMWIERVVPSEPCMLALPEGDAWLAGSGDWLRAACIVGVHDL